MISIAPHSPQHIRAATRLCATVCALLGGVAHADTIDATAFAAHFDITFPGYSGSAPLADFPVLVRVSPSLNGFNYSACAAGGADLRFADAEGNLLSCEIDTWNTSGESLVWVKVPSLSRSTRITAYYGCANPPANTPAAVWSNGYVGVWHLGGTSLPLSESSGVSTPFSTLKGETAEVLGATGILGGAVDFSSATTNRLEAADDDDLDGFTDFTVELWSKQENGADTQRYLLNKCASDGYTYRLYQNRNTPKDVFQIFYDGTDQNKRTSIAGGNSDMVPATGAWNHQVFIRDFSANTARCYMNGSQSPANAVDLGSNFSGISMANSTSPLYLGNTTGNNPSVAFPGQIDELRISNVARSADWVQATHDCVADADFAAYGVDNDWTKYARKFTVTFSGYAGSAPLTDFPVLVRVSTNSPVGFSYADCQKPNGGDLRFADASGNLLPSEVDTWNTNGQSLVWVKVPTLSASTKISAYYGWAFAPSVEATNVWDSGYVGVWHLGESALPLKESSGTSTDFTESADSQEILAATGAVGGAVDFAAGTRYSRLLALDDDDLDGFTDFTVEMWTKQESPCSDYQPYLLAKTASSQYAYIFYQNRAAQSAFKIGIDGLDSGNIITGIAMTPSMDSWTHQTVVRDTAKDKAFAFLNGNPVSDGVTLTSTSAITSSTSPLYLGNANGNSPSSGFPGQIDELRISKVARSADWVKATHDTAVSDDFALYSATRGNDCGTIFFVR